MRILSCIIECMHFFSFNKMKAASIICLLPLSQLQYLLSVPAASSTCAAPTASSLPLIYCLITAPLSTALPFCLKQDWLVNAQIRPQQQGYRRDYTPLYTQP